MNLELEVRKRVKDNYGSAQNFVKCIGIPYSTDVYKRQPLTF